MTQGLTRDPRLIKDYQLVEVYSANRHVEEKTKTSHSSSETTSVRSRYHSILNYVTSFSELFVDVLCDEGAWQLPDCYSLEQLS